MCSVMLFMLVVEIGHGRHTHPIEISKYANQGSATLYSLLQASPTPASKINDNQHITDSVWPVGTGEMLGGVEIFKKFII